MAASTVRTEATEQLQIIQQRILTRDTLLDMSNRLQIYAPRPGEAQQALDADALVEDMRRRISMVTTSGGQRGQASATLVAVSFEAADARLAATVTNELVTLILREDVGMRTRTARQTLEFFEQEVARLDKDLAQRGATILSFKEKNQDALPDSLEFSRSQQAGNQERLLQLEREEASLKDRRSRVIGLRDSDVTGQDDTPVRDRSPEAESVAEPARRTLRASGRAVFGEPQDQAARGAASPQWKRWWRTSCRAQHCPKPVNRWMSIRFSLRKSTVSSTSSHRRRRR